MVGDKCVLSFDENQRIVSNVTRQIFHACMVISG